MKAWIVGVKDEPYSSVVFAETRGKARSLAMSIDGCSEAQFTDIEVYRKPQMDKYYKEGRRYMDWDNPKDRLALVKDCSFVCDPDYIEYEDCEECSAKEYCDQYKDHKENSDD